MLPTFCPRIEMSALNSRIHFQAARNNLGIDMMIEVGDQALISLSLSRNEIERMLEAISIALDENKDDDLNDDE
jgi:ribosome assembly protein YihI (activator of Der GTPase)